MMPRQEGEGYRKFYPNTVLFEEAIYQFGGNGRKDNPALSLEAAAEVEESLCQMGLDRALIGTLSIPNAWVEDTTFPS
jgi:hypothetical protein